MKIAIDTTPLTNAHKDRGVGSYTKNLIEALQKYENKHSYTLFTRGQKIPDTVEIVHYPYFDPFFLTLPLNKPKPTIVTVHDLIPIVFPDKFPPGIRGALKWQLQKASLGGAKRIIADSESSKSDIVRITGIDKRRVDVVYLAPDPSLSRACGLKHSSNRYFLYVGDVNWNKNVPGLLRAFSSFKNVELVLVGSSFTDATLPQTKEINRLIDALGIEQSVRRTGQVSTHELAGLYAGAIALIQPSFYEGFGLPVVDAMQCGCPVVSADTSSLREIAGPSIRVKPESSSIADGIKHVLGLSDSQRKKLISDGFLWIEKFSWQKVARETVASYEKALV